MEGGANIVRTRQRGRVSKASEKGLNRTSVMLVLARPHYFPEPGKSLNCHGARGERRARGRIERGAEGAGEECEGAIQCFPPSAPH